MNYDINLSFEEIDIPGFDDILILGRRAQQGNKSLFRAMEYIIPNGYDMIELDDPLIQAIYIRKKILKRVNKKTILEVLQEKVFNLMSEDEIIKCNFDVKVRIDAIQKNVTA